MDALTRVLCTVIVACTFAGCLSAQTESHGPITAPPPQETTPRAGTAAPTRVPAPADAAVVARGLALYKENYCGTCHTLDKAGTGGIFGPTHNGMRATAEKRIHDAAYTGSATTPAAYVRESIVEPGRYLVPGYEQTRFHMPVYTNLSNEDIDALVQMLLAED